MGMAVYCTTHLDHIPWFNRFWDMVSRITYRTIQMSTESDTPRCDHSRKHWARHDEAGMAYDDGQQIERELNAAINLIKELNATTNQHGRYYRSCCGKFLDSINKPKTNNHE
jgi:hypothetical protein